VDVVLGGCRSEEMENTKETTETQRHGEKQDIITSVSLCLCGVISLLRQAARENSFKSKFEAFRRDSRGILYQHWEVSYKVPKI
jgi:hypothetical protein